MKNCLTCEFEPLWSDPVGIEYKRQSGACRWNLVLPVMPSHFFITTPHIIMHSDKSGLPRNCKAWTPKIIKE